MFFAGHAGGLKGFCVSIPSSAFPGGSIDISGSLVKSIDCVNDTGTQLICKSETGVSSYALKAASAVYPAQTTTIAQLFQDYGSTVTDTVANHMDSSGDVIIGSFRRSTEPQTERPYVMYIGPKPQAESDSYFIGSGNSVTVGLDCSLFRNDGACLGMRACVTEVSPNITLGNLNANRGTFTATLAPGVTGVRTFKNHMVFTKPGNIGGTSGTKTTVNIVRGSLAYGYASSMTVNGVDIHSVSVVDSSSPPAKILGTYSLDIEFRPTDPDFGPILKRMSDGATHFVYDLIQSAPPAPTVPISVRAVRPGTCEIWIGGVKQALNVTVVAD